MSASARIDELKRKFDENPRRYFAPLANEYRKFGDLEQAISICRAYLPQQPGHISGHIVFGQALFEGGQYDEARSVFETALTLDPENLIALRHLGDIARQGGDLGAARQWYTRVLEADPRNEEIAALLGSLEPEDAATPAPPQQMNAEVGDAAVPARDLGATQPVPVVGAVPAAPAAPAPAAAAFLQLERAGDAQGSAGAAAVGGAPASRPPAADAPAKAPGLESTEFVAPAAGEGPAPLAGLAAEEDFFTNIVTPAAPGDTGTPDAFVTETMAELYLQQGFEQEALNVYKELLARNPGDAGLRERVEQLASGARSSVAVGSVSEEVVESARRRQAARPKRTIRAFLGALAGRRIMRAFDGDGARDRPAAAAAPAPSLDDAWVVPPASTGARPHEAPAPASGDAEVEWWTPDAPSARSEPAEPDPWAAPARGALAGGAAAESQREDSTRPQRASGAVDALFARAPVSHQDDAAASVLAGAFTDGDDRASPPSVQGRPSRAAATELSLDHVFRDSERKPAPGARDGGSYSFDQFFAETPQEPQAPADEAAPPEREHGARDDIEQFNSWLQGLKKK
ncbi:MAG TPA: tetratricopeptide repeat protein [Gemmatimonadaceae bacterium]|nr:tetratricopeptide repeat protein [Gemmatimonadaceae bacterium]